MIRVWDRKESEFRTGIEPRPPEHLADTLSTGLGELMDCIKTVFVCDRSPT